MPISILQHTPVWVWAILGGLLWAGIAQTAPRTVTLRRATLLPATMLTLSLWGVVSAFGLGPALATWALGVLVAAGMSLRAGGPHGVRWSAAGQVFHLPGIWMPLTLMFGIFCIKFGVGVSLGLQPGLRGSAGFAAATSLAYGAASGVFAGRALALWRLARPGPQLRSA
jgi:hypothetical protein